MAVRLAAVRTDDLAALPIKALMSRNPAVDWAAVDDVIYGCANQAGEDNRNVARMALLLAGPPVAVPGATINRLCGSASMLVASAARMIRGGEAELVTLPGAVESMSRAPYVLSKGEVPFARDVQLFDTTIGWRFVNDAHEEACMGRLDAGNGPRTSRRNSRCRAPTRTLSHCAVNSARCAPRPSGTLAEEIVPVTLPAKKGEPERCVSRDEHPRETSIEALAKLPTPFRAGGDRDCGQRVGQSTMARRRPCWSRARRPRRDLQARGARADRGGRRGRR